MFVHLAELQHVLWKLDNKSLIEKRSKGLPNICETICFNIAMHIINENSVMSKSVYLKYFQIIFLLCIKYLGINVFCSIP